MERDRAWEKAGNWAPVQERFLSLSPSDLKHLNLKKLK